MGTNGVVPTVPVHSCIACPDGKGCCICNNHDHPSTPIIYVSDTTPLLPIEVEGHPNWDIQPSGSGPDIYLRDGKPYIMIDGEEFELHASRSEPDPKPEPPPPEPEPQECNLWDHLKD